MFLLPFIYKKITGTDLELFKEYLLGVVTVIPAFLSVFSSPSSYVSEVKCNHLSRVTKCLKKAGIGTKEMLQPIKANIEVLEKRIKSKILSLRGIVALVWALIFCDFSST